MNRRASRSQRFGRGWLTLAALAVVTVLVVAGAAAGLLAPYSYAAQHPEAINTPPGNRFLLGTDGLGRDILSRLLYGAGISLAVGLLSQVVVVLLGVPIALIAGYFRGRVDAFLMQVVDVFLSIPDLLFVIVVTTIVGGALESVRTGPLAWLAALHHQTSGLLLIIAVVGLTGWLALARLVRGEVLSLTQLNFVEAAHAIGLGPGRLMRRHLLPNVMDTIIVTVTLGIPRAIFLEAALGFLGLGVQPPLPSWGTMIADGVQAMRFTPHVVLGPSVLLAITMLAFNFLGDGLRDALDPHLPG
jgi:oligopeptide transport system permease protein